MMNYVKGLRIVDHIFHCKLNVLISFQKRRSQMYTEWGPSHFVNELKRGNLNLTFVDLTYFTAITALLAQRSSSLCDPRGLHFSLL